MWPRATEGGFGGCPPIRGCDIHPFYNVPRSTMLPSDNLAPSDGGGGWGVLPPFEAATFTRSTMLPSDDMAPNDRGGVWGGLPPFEAATFTRFAMLPLDDMAQSDRGGFGGSPPIRGCDFHPICNDAL